MNKEISFLTVLEKLHTIALYIQDYGRIHLFYKPIISKSKNNIYKIDINIDNDYTIRVNALDTVNNDTNVIYFDNLSKEEMLELFLYIKEFNIRKDKDYDWAILTKEKEEYLKRKINKLLLKYVF